MKSIQVLGLSLLLFLSAISVSAQNRGIRRGDKFYESLAYPLAIRNYERGLKKEQDLRAMQRLADAYLQVGDYGHAENMYAQVVNMPGSTPEDKLAYGQVLKINGKYDKAQTWFESYMKTGENPNLAARMIESCDYAKMAKLDSTRYKIKPVPYNTQGSDLGAVPFRQGMVFTSERKSAGTKLVNLRNNNRFYDLYYMTPQPTKKGYKVKRLKGKVNSKFHDGPGMFSSRNDVIYFTRSEWVKDKADRIPENRSKLKIMSATMNNGKWSSLEYLNFNGETYSCGHPAISADGTFMVFASDIAGGFGGTDLYIVRKESGKWGTPRNLGSEINTEGDEAFPFLHNNGTLFFASDGHPGMGGMDIFSANASGESWTNVQNMGYPLNTSYDDFTIYFFKNKAGGFFASNRDGDDDIYSFERSIRIEGTVVDKRTGSPVEGAMVTILDMNNREVKVQSDAEGKFEAPAAWGQDYMVTISKEDFLQVRERISSREMSPVDDLVQTFEMERDLVFRVSGDVVDGATGKPIEDARIRVIGKTETPLQTDAAGHYEGIVDENQEYTVLVMNHGYVPQVFHFTTVGKNETENFVFNARLEKGNYLLVEGKTVKSTDRSALSGVNVRTVNADDRKESRASLSRGDGRFWQVLDPTTEQYLIGSREGYFASRVDMPIVAAGKDSTVMVEISMIPYELGAIVKIIYYDYNKSDIKKNASKDLYEIVYFLSENPEASVELSSHTDSRGGATYNQNLSRQRAESARSFIISKGISGRRVSAKGFGESRLTNGCNDGAKCTEEEHTANRRTEIKVTRLDESKVIQGNGSAGN